MASAKVWKLIRATDGSCHARLLVVIIKLTLGDLRSDVTRPPSEALHLRGADFERWSRSLLQGLAEDMADLQRRDPAAWDEYQAEVEMLTTFNGID